MKQLIATLVASIVHLPVLAQAQAPDCSSRKSLTIARAEIDQALKAMGDDASHRKAQLVSALRAKADRLGWPDGRQSDLIKKAFSSRDFSAFEEEKQPLVAAVMQAVLASSGPHPSATPCESAETVKSLAHQFMRVSVRQHAQAASDIGLATGSDAQ